MLKRLLTFTAVIPFIFQMSPTITCAETTAADISTALSEADEDIVMLEIPDQSLADNYININVITSQKHTNLAWIGIMPLETPHDVISALNEYYDGYELRYYNTDAVEVLIDGKKMYSYTARLEVPDSYGEFEIRVYDGQESGAKELAVKYVSFASPNDIWAEICEDNLVTISNPYTVYNKPTADTIFTLSEKSVIEGIQDYHWNADEFDIDYLEQTISIENTKTKEIVYSGYVCSDSGYMDRQNALWYVFPYIVLPAGEYRIIDSHPESWSQNSSSGGSGFVLISGYAAGETGDTNGDGVADARDASAVLTEYAMTSASQPSVLNRKQKMASDVNNDQTIDARDASLILAFYAFSSTQGGKDMTFDSFLESQKQ